MAVIQYHFVQFALPWEKTDTPHLAETGQEAPLVRFQFPLAGEDPS